MSVTYPEFSYTSFPDKTDTLNNFIDITLTSLPLAKQYYQLYNAGDMDGANAILANNPSLKYSQISASTLNPIIDSIKAMQLFYMSDVQTYLMNIVQYKGEYSPSTKYSKYNTVKYYHNSALETFMCISSDTPISTLPTNNTYWIPLTMRGEKGEAGIGLSAYGTWNVNTTYPEDAMVAFSNAIWGSLVSNVGIEPNLTAVSTWYKIIEFNSDYLTFKDAITTKAYTLTINNGEVYLLTDDSQIDIARKIDIPSSLPANGGNSATVNGKTVLTNVPLGAVFTDTVTTVNGKTGTISKADIVALGIPAQDTLYSHPPTHSASMITGLPTSLPANGGNADTTDGFHFAIDTVVPTSLTNNTFCFVYE